MKGQCQGSWRQIGAKSRSRKPVYYFVTTHAHSTYFRTGKQTAISITFVMTLATEILTVSRNGVGTDTNDNLDTNLQNALDINTVRTQFPGLPEGTALFNNASGTVVFKGAIER